MPTLLIIHGTTRPSRTGILVSRALEALAKDITNFDVEFADLKEINLPFLDELEPPRAGNYQRPHTRAWATTVDRADAIVWATPQYNGSFSAPLKNAIDYLAAEWEGKPLGIIAWGYHNGGLDAARALAPVAASLRMRLVEPLLGYTSYGADLKDGSLAISEEWTQNATALLKGLEEHAA
ncbi:NADPH-dependent FMN reductase [Dermabacter vaginalis]|uniref:NAD(P)H-dependent oxidoreductase n=1 Tax=Dermabacter vaginalis TaxID=1630135 RepID=A0ABX6A320_9MICO|nr:NAD(P)H-dependent oxidoreductase [Dermabacter vaginalis]QEU11034.1 NAD(P)H-dependent oxidoreductase [Dermabacter vaginalis]